MADYGFTFDVSEVPLAKEKCPLQDYMSVLSDKMGFKWVEACSGRGQQTIMYDSYCRNAFIETSLLAFDRHYPLVLSPDDIWLCLLQAIAVHVKSNAEALRDKFVAHEGRKDIKVRRDEFARGSPDNDWAGVIKELGEMVRAQMTSWQNEIKGSFSTSTDLHHLVNDIALFEMLEKHVRIGMVSRCGIPQITLLGTVDDWVSIRERAARFAELGLDWWLVKLLPVLDTMVETRRGNPDVAFWKSFVKQDSNSGGPYITGWINVFYPYLTPEDENTTPNPWLVDGTHFTKSEHLPYGRSDVPFVWQCEAETIDLRLIGGFLGIRQDGSVPASPLAVRPDIGWAVIDPSKSRDEVWAEEGRQHAAANALKYKERNKQAAEERQERRRQLEELLARAEAESDERWIAEAARQADLAGRPFEEETEDDRAKRRLKKRKALKKAWVENETAIARAEQEAREQEERAPRQAWVDEGKQLNHPLKEDPRRVYINGQ